MLHLYHDSRFNLNFMTLSPILIIYRRRLGRGDRGMDWKKLLGSVTESVDEELRLRNAYLVAENRILRQQINGRLPLTDSDRKALAEIVISLARKPWQRLHRGHARYHPRLASSARSPESRHLH